MKLLSRDIHELADTECENDGDNQKRENDAEAAAFNRPVSLFHPEPNHKCENDNDK